MPPNTPNAPMGITPAEYNQLQEYARQTGANVYPYVSNPSNQNFVPASEILERLNPNNMAIGATSPLGGSMGGAQYIPRFPSSLQEQYEKLFSSSLQRLNNQFAQGQSAIDPILEQQRREFYTQTAPGLAEMFTAGGGSGATAGSNFIGQLGAAGAGLNENLAGLRARYNLDERNQLLHILGQSPYETVFAPAQQQPPQRKWWQDLLASLGQAGAGAAAGFLAGGPVGAAVGGLGGLGSSVANSLLNRGQVAPAPVQRQVVSNAGSFPAVQQQAQQFGNFLQGLEPSSGAGKLLTPQALQQLQSITGSTVGAAEDFARTFRQPGTRQSGSRGGLYSRLTPELAQYAGVR